ncbi:hypothetical protein CDL15_Pgr024099 [Punica granatum]|uniref:GH18 domain-containing protein n=1 Tax=Punica granatum TaxID=22663 RepID=A0A218XXX2_PUNGR|nr:hypothetical protein CDL15_Pgr024099 [Punica granatum]
MKQKHPNVKFAVILGGDSVAGCYAYLAPKSTKSWVTNAVSSITRMVREFDLDGVDIDYEHFKASPVVFAECIGQLITLLKKDKSGSRPVPSSLEEVRASYVNFQFYAYDRIGVPQFVGHFNQQAHNYNGGHTLASFLVQTF